MKIRRWLLWVHGWIGITVGAWLAVVGLTGSVLLWRPELEPRLESRLTLVQPQPSKVSLQTVYDAVRRAYPRQKIDRIYPSPAPNRAHEVRLPKNGLSVFVNPYSGRIIGSQTQRSDFYNTVDELHVRLLSADVGHFLVGVGGFVLLTMALSGIWLWWPRTGQWRRALVPNLRTNWRGRNYELHRVIGIFVCGILIANALTGIMLVWTEPTRTALSAVLGSTKDPKIRKGIKGQWLPLDTLVSRANAALPGGDITRITWPKNSGAPLVVRKHLPGELNPAGNCSVSIDPVAGRVVNVEDSRHTDAVTRWLNLRYPLHTGLWGGVLTRVLYTFIGLTLPAFYVSGLFLWFLKRRQKGKVSRRQSASAPTSSAVALTK